MEKQTVRLIGVFVLTASILFLATGCGKTNFLGQKFTPLKIEKVNMDDLNTGNGFTGGEAVNDGNTGYNAAGLCQDLDPDSKNGLYPLFSGVPGVPVSMKSMSAISPDPSGMNALNDYDGDGIPNDQELLAEFSNPYVADYPRITTRIDTPVTMTIVVSETDTSQNLSEQVSDSDVKNTIANSMEAKQYNQLNKKTTPYVTKNSDSWSEKNAGSYGYSHELGYKVGVKVSAVVTVETELESNTKMSRNASWDLEQSRSTMSERTVFDDINYVDNLNRNGTEFKNDKVEKISKNFRQSNISKEDFVVGPNAGVVKAGLWITNESRNQPVRISNVTCTLSFLTPSGKSLPVKTFRLRNDDYSEFDQEIGGGEDKGPYAVVIDSINTYDMKNALRNGYTPQITVVNYDMNRVEDSPYNPGVDNLKMVEETVKKRTAVIKIIGNGTREFYRVPAFEVDEDGVVTPGVSLKKALFHIYASRIGSGESWDIDEQGNVSTVNDQCTKWKAGFIPDPDKPGEYRYGTNVTGNSWRMFSTYVKRYIVVDRDASGKIVEKEKRIETIERIGQLKKYNPFNLADNPGYDPNEPLSSDEFVKMKYWIILHNGQYFDGDINDPIWAGERYEIVLFDARDFNDHYETFAYTPLQNNTNQDLTSGSSSQDFIQYSAIQSYSDFTLNTMWNNYFTQHELDRARYLGKITRGDVVKLEVELDEFRSLFDVNQPGREFDQPVSVRNVNGKVWHKFNYTFDSGATLPAGQLGTFTSEVWGGCNSITLWINNASNAQYYTVSFWRQGELEANAKVAKISLDEINENNGYITLNRQSRDMQGNPVGELVPANFRVKVRACGRAYNVPVTRVSDKGIQTVTVQDPAGNGWPAPYSISANGYENGVNVVINQSDNAEFYLIDVYGPYNYGNGNGEVDGYQIPKVTFKAHAGTNLLPITKPDDSSMGHAAPLTDDEKNFAVPGVYRVAVYAANRNSLDAEGNPDQTKIVAAQGDPSAVMVDYNRYQDQKSLVPKVQVEEFSPKDVDFEVNFNDGSGWFRLKLSDDDTGQEDRVIDCRYTTNFVMDKNRVTIYFTPPTGSQGPQNRVYDVFRGGADEVTVYLRTVAKPEYRDSLWLKPNANPNFNPGGSRCVNINSLVNNLPEFDPMRYWIINPNTDSTMIENFNSGGSRAHSSLPSLGGVPSGDFGAVARNGKTDFFFSPMKKLTYNVSASISNADVEHMMAGLTHVDNPQYRPLGGERKIMLSHLDSQYGNLYKISWVVKNNPNDPWNHAEFTAGGNSHSFTLNNLLPNIEYLVYVTAENSSSVSSPVYSTVKTMPEPVNYQLTAPGTNNNGAGTFMDRPVPLINDLGNILLAGSDFQYGQTLDGTGGSPYNMYDTGASGSLANERYIRIVHNGINIAGPAGLNLTPVAKDLSSAIVSPPANQCYIDPATGKFVLPRPLYWSCCENTDSLINPEISVPGYAPTQLYSNSFYNGFSQGVYNSGWGVGYIGLPNTLFPFGDRAVPFIDKGTISLWWTPNIYYYNGSYGGLTINLTTQVSLEWSFYNPGLLTIHYNGSYVTIYNVPISLFIFNHIYVIWDNAGLENGTYLRLYVNNTYVASIPVQLNGNPYIYINPTGQSVVDNIKIWNQVVSDGAGAAAWEYDPALRKENALHPIYGSASGYRPVLTAPGGVGFSAIPSW